MDQTKQPPGFTDTATYTVNFGGCLFEVVVGTVSEGMCKGAIAVYSINGQSTWRTPNFIRETVMRDAMLMHSAVGPCPN